MRAAHDAHLALTTGPAEGEPMLEVFIGGWSNTKSVIRKNKQQPEKAETATPDILSAGEFRGFWIRWADNVSGEIGDFVRILYWDVESRIDCFSYQNVINYVQF